MQVTCRYLRVLKYSTAQRAAHEEFCRIRDQSVCLIIGEMAPPCATKGDMNSPQIDCFGTALSHHGFGKQEPTYSATQPSSFRTE